MKALRLAATQFHTASARPMHQLMAEELKARCSITLFCLNAALPAALGGAQKKIGIQIKVYWKSVRKE
jgi:hypothetical protein